MDATPDGNRLPPGQQLVSPDKWPYVGEREPRVSDEPWFISISGLVAEPRIIGLDQLAGMPQTEMVTDIHCVTRWSKFDARFSGVTLADLIRDCQVDSRAQFVSFVARSERRHSSSLPLQQAIELGAMLATHYDGQPLATDHGGPVRGVVPRKYFYKSVKWVEQIVLLEADQPGYWESESGYHNGADPWKEERYIASQISKRDAASLVGKRDFSNLDLLGIDVAALELCGLTARGALLRNANFDKCNLEGADFRQANLSNASFRGASLVNADFANADLEGADLAGADLRGANLAGCSLFGTTFCDATADGIDQAARLDPTTRIDRSSLTALTDVQQSFIGRFLDSV